MSHCKALVQTYHLDMLCILENRIHVSSLSDLNFINSHKVYDLESCCNNFQCANPGRIWLKWNSDTLVFQPSFFSSQMIIGMVYYGSCPPFLLSVIYASNQQSERRVLWEDLRSLSPTGGIPWLVLGDFNCCRLPSEKLGGNSLQQHQLYDFNSVIFDTKLHDLASMGPLYTWYNQMIDSPIHIRLDRMLVNEY